MKSHIGYGAVCVLLCAFTLSCSATKSTSEKDAPTTYIYEEETYKQNFGEIIRELLFLGTVKTGTLEKTTRIAKPRDIDFYEFKSFFAESKLDYLDGCYYHGHKDGFIYLSIVNIQKWGKKKDEIHTIFAYIVPEDNIEFEPRMEIANYVQDEGVWLGRKLKIVSRQRYFSDKAFNASYTLHNPVNLQL